MHSIFILFIISLVSANESASELLGVILLHRHGDRAPLVTSPRVNQSEYNKQWPLGLI